MADVFLSYASADRARAETLRQWLEQAGWSVWIDRHIDVGEDWTRRIEQELAGSRLVVVLWSAEALRSEWVQRETRSAMQDGRLLQVLGTGLQLLPPFDRFQAVRMQAWTGEEVHSERLRLLEAVATRLGTTLPEDVRAPRPGEDLTAYRLDVAEVISWACAYCARQLERVQLQQARGYRTQEDWNEAAKAYDVLLALLRKDGLADDDRETVLHTMLRDFADQLERLVPGSMS